MKNEVIKISNNQLIKTEEGFRSFIELISDWIWELDKNAEYTYNSPRVKEILGYEPEEMIGKKIFNLMPEEERKGIKELFQEIIESQKPFKILENIYSHKDGHRVILETRGVPIFNKDGDFQGYWGIHHDISDRKKIEEKLRSYEAQLRKMNMELEYRVEERTGELNEIAEKYSAIVKAFDGLIYICSQDYKVEFMNEKFIKRTGYDGVGDFCYRALHNRDSICPWCVNDRVFSGETVKWEIQSPKDNRWYYIVNTPITHLDGTISKMAMILDITEQKEALQNLKESEEKFRTAFNSSAISMSITTIEEGRIIEANDVCLSDLSFKREELVGKTTKELNIWVEKSQRDLMIQLVKEKRNLNNFQMKFRTKEGDIRYGLFSVNIISLNGKPHLLNIVNDITERVRYEQKLKESEENYRNLYEDAPNAYFSIGIDKSILRCNKAAEKLLGYTKEELLEMKVFDLYSDTENGLPKAKNLFQKFSKGELIQDEELQMKNKNGEHVWISLSVKPVLDKRGNIIESRSMVIDINKRKQAEKALKTERDKLKAIIDGLTSAGLGIDIIGDNYKVQYMNKTMKERFGDFIGKLCYENYMESKEPCEGCPVMKSIKTNTIEHVEQSSVDNRNYEIFSAPIPNADGTINKAIEFIIDITERKKAEKELISLNKLKSELLTRYSHELKTPLMSIKGFTSLLSNKFNDTLHDEELSLIDEITKGCHRLETLVRDILNTAELDSGTVELELTKSDLTSVIRSCVEELNGLANSRNHTINLTLDDKLITTFDIQQITQVVNNILTNAIKFTPPQGIITIQSEIREDLIVILIRDTGIGFTNEETQNLFKRFGKIERFGQGFDVITEGSGLGLYISKKIIELHGGEIWVESEGKNKGSTFYFTLPLI